MIIVKGEALANLVMVLSQMEIWHLSEEQLKNLKVVSVTFPPNVSPFPIEVKHASQTSSEENRSAQEIMPNFLNWMELAKKSCDNLFLKLSAKSADRIVESLKERPLTIKELGQACGELRARIQDELAEIMLLEVEPEKAHLMQAKNPFGEEVSAALPDIAFDDEAAGFCLGFDCNTACVFHLMRVMEVGLQKLGTKLGVALANEKNWQNILDEVNKAIKSLDQKAQATKELASVAAHLYNVKLAWRNEVMHPNAKYLPTEADDIFKNVGVFIKHLICVI